MAAPGAEADTGQLADNILHFGRLLRSCGMRVGSGTILDAVAAVEATGFGSKARFKTTLRTVFVSRREDIAVFDEAFALFWSLLDARRDVQALMTPLSPKAPKKDTPRAGRTRVSNAMMGPRPRDLPPPEQENDPSAALTASTAEKLGDMDFAQMNLSEWQAALAAMRRLQMKTEQVPTRRFGPAPKPGRFDPRATLRGSLRSGGVLLKPGYRDRRHRPPPLVILADISGSMSDYSRMILHFAHLMTAQRPRVSTFLFGTRLSNVTRPMRLSDPDAALAACGDLVQDWSGGTRISDALRQFNRVWGRRVLGQGAVVLLFTDGLEQGDTTLLAAESDRLHRSCRRLVWLNPLLRFDEFEPRARGIRCLLRHVDEFRPCHNLKSLQELVLAAG